MSAVPNNLMLHARLTAGNEAAHDSIDQAMADTAALLSMTLRARQQIKVPDGQRKPSGTFGQPEIEAIMASLNELTAGRRSAITAHFGIKALGVRLNLITAEGDLGEKPDWDISDGTEKQATAA